MASRSRSPQGQSKVGPSLCVCFDFDGVIGNSVDELSTTAWKHAKELWPNLREKLDDSYDELVKIHMRKLRPVIETGFEATLLIRVLLEARPDCAGIVDRILSEWATMWPKLLDEWNLSKEEVVSGFGRIRDEWIKADLKGWLSLSRPYEGVPNCIKGMLAAGVEVFVITTKQRRFTEELLHDYGLVVPSDHIFTLEDGPKTGVLKRLLSRPELAGRTMHFIEDKIGNLRKVVADSDLKDVHLHLVDWGYNTEKEQSEANDSASMSLLSSVGLKHLGLDDGSSWN